MTPSEFKAWFDGFTEALDDVPSKKQWARIKERVAEIDGKPVTERVYVDRYWPSYPPYARPYLWQGAWYGANVCNSTLGATLSAQSQSYHNAVQGLAAANGTLAHYNSHTAMNALGRAEAQAMTQ